MCGQGSAEVVETRRLSAPDPRVGSVPALDGRFREVRSSQGGVWTGADAIKLLSVLDGCRVTADTSFPEVWLQFLLRC